MLILLGVVIHGVKQFTAENADTKKGIEYIQSKENEEVKVIEQKKEHHIHHVENQQAKMPYLLFIWKCVNLPNNKQRTQRENNGQ